MKKIYLGLLSLSIIAVACESRSGNSTAPQPLPGNSSQPLPYTNTLTQTAQPADSQQPGKTQPQNIVQPLNVQPVNNSTAGLNPAHGQPGHRCDIQVGAPLNSAPAAVAPPPVNATPQITPVMSSPVINPQPAANGQRLNPAHGQPGHDCAIPVGQPLKN